MSESKKPETKASEDTNKEAELGDNKSKMYNPEDLEIKIEKYPYATSPLLIDEFFLMGYTENLLQEKIINPIISEITTKNNLENYYNITEKKIRYLPSALSSISSETIMKKIDIENLTEYAFPNPASIYCYIENNNTKNEEPKVYQNIFNNNNNDTICNGYVYHFYEKKNYEIYMGEKKYNLIFYFPKFFIIISQYNYFFVFYQICTYLYQQFLREDNEIPLEIQIYNIVNYLPCPLNSKVELSIYAKNNVLNIKTFDEFKKNNIIFLEQLGAYKHSELNFCKIFEICTPEFIIQILLQILTGDKMAFFHENPEILSYFIFFLYQITFPLTPKEDSYYFNPNKYYFMEDNNFLQLIGFSCFFDQIKNYHPKKNFLIFEKEQEFYRKDLFVSRGDFTLVDLKTCNIKFYSLEDEENEEDDEIDNASEEKLNTKENEQHTYNKENQIKVDINSYLLKLFKKQEKPSSVPIEINKIINELYESLLNLSNIVKEKKYFSFLAENDDIKKYSIDIQEAFIRFIALFCNCYLNYQKKKSDIEKIEKKIFDNFKNTGFCDMLENMKDYYKPKEPIFMRISKKNFINLMSIFKIDETNQMLFKGHFLKFLDCMFVKGQETQSVSFFDFFKYYNENLKKDIFKLTNDINIDKRKIKKEKLKEYNYYYKYKTINLSSNLILKYNLLLTNLSEEIKSKIFPKKVQIDNQYLYSKDINELIDNYLISNKLLNFKNLLQFCILSIVVISIGELKLMAFTEPIYNLFDKMNLQIRKYVELILNVSYRFLVKCNIKSKQEVNQYFDIFKKALLDKNLCLNDELTKLQKIIKEFVKSKEDGYNIIPKNIISKILVTDEDSLYELIPDKLSSENYDDVQKEGKIEKKISLTASLLDNKEINQDFIYYPNTLFRKLSEMMYRFYHTLDIEKERDEYYKLIINVMFYVRLIKDKFPDNTLKFLFYCLIKENNINETGGTPK